MCSVSFVPFLCEFLREFGFKQEVQYSYTFLSLSVLCLFVQLCKDMI